MTPASPKDDAGPSFSVSGATGSEVGAGDGTRTGDTSLHLRVKESAGDGSLRDGSEDGKSLEWRVAEKAGSMTTEETMAREDEGRDLVKAEAREGEEHIPQEGELSATEPLHDQSPTPAVIVDAHVPAVGAWQDATAGGDPSTRVEEAEADHPLEQSALTHELAAVEDTTADMTRVDERSAVHVQEGMDADSDNGSDPLSATPWEAINPPSANGHPEAQGYSPPKAFGKLQTKACVKPAPHIVQTPERLTWPRQPTCNPLFLLLFWAPSLRFRVWYTAYWTDWSTPSSGDPSRGEGLHRR
jgi:hypothetical protein